MVQAFHLPRNTHVTSSHTSPPAREIPKLVDELEEPATSDAPAGFLASDFVMMDADSDIEPVVGLQPEHGHCYVPKTMQEMAEEHAARRHRLDSDADDDLDYEVNDGEEETASPQVPLAARPARKSKKQTTVKITLPSEASRPNNISRSRSTKAKMNKKKPSTTPNLKRKRRSSRKKVEEESDSADLTVTSEEENQQVEQPSPSKRTRGRVAAAEAKRMPVAIAPSTRTLRPRISNTTPQIEEK